ncbi:hypothetical protein [Aequorivita xiaoshiensis]|uniref:Uncharacterized protein n=1 Tax=Aequorivita xiaoshiensis TaxID=2874476 RepID=A0A9X1R376_9FLAO|nr:hypothetical protein [Aequorivita xiaoshiensis]MCG2431890.1 hypothetical protein [Aequorivita xiaoshiensis]
MKLSVISYLVITTLVLTTVAIFAALGFSFDYIFFLTVIGEVLLIYSVYSVLSDYYTTDKKFKDFYEDHPIKKEEDKL